MVSTELSVTRFDLTSVILHWLIAVFVIGLFASGLWMVDLGYYDDWYYKAPWWHKSVGVMTLGLVVIRAVWSQFRLAPAQIITIALLQRHIAKLVKVLMTLMLATLFVSGYLIVTAKGDGLSVFDVFVIPSIIQQSNITDIAGDIHLLTAYLLIGLSVLHALAAMKHHFIDKDATLKRMLFIQSGES